MNEIREKLITCFSAVFPQLTPDQIAAASAANLSEWDSIAHVTLLNVIGEEFQRDIDFEEFEGATSFGQILERLRESTANA